MPDRATKRPLFGAALPPIRRNGLLAPAWLALAGVALGAGPDAEIVALCDEAKVLDAAHEAEIAALDREGAFMGEPTPEQEAAHAAARAKSRRAHEIVGLLCVRPSATLAGVRAKASVVAAFNSGCAGTASCEATPELARVVCDELARVTAGPWRAWA